MKLEVFYRPGMYLNNFQLDQLVQEIRSVATTCFDSVPYYQALTGKREELGQVLIVLAKNDQDQVVGFCSAVLLKVSDIGEALHLGLTCVRPEYRGKKLTHVLTSKLITHYLFKISLLRPFWITNVACVISSLANVAMHFDNVYPSPFTRALPGQDHLKIAHTISLSYREQIAIDSAAQFNEQSFVFQESVKGSVFAKEAGDQRFHHRQKELTQYYVNAIDFTRGDEILQVGRVSAFTFFRYYERRFIRPFFKFLTKGLRPATTTELKA